MIRRLLLASAVLAVAACNAPPSTGPAPETPAPTPAPVPGPPVSAADKLSASGFGPLHVGMTVAGIEAAMGPDSEPDAVGGPDPVSCDMFHPTRAPDGLSVMVQDGVLVSVWLSQNTTVETDRGLNIGDTAAEVKRAYGAAAQVTPHKYQGPPAEYINVWTSTDHSSPAARGLKYEIGADGKVQAIAGGGPSIDYVEGCA